MMTEPTNKDRAERANKMLEAYELADEYVDHDSKIDHMADALTDMMHLCDKLGFTFEDALEQATGNYRGEVMEARLDDQ